MINKLNIEYNPDLFSNPKLKIQQQTIETLALQLEKSDPPPDTTRKFYLKNINSTYLLF